MLCLNFSDRYCEDIYYLMRNRLQIDDVHDMIDPGFYSIIDPGLNVVSKAIALLQDVDTEYIISSNECVAFVDTGEVGLDFILVRSLMSRKVKCYYEYGGELQQYPLATI